MTKNNVQSLRGFNMFAALFALLLFLSTGIAQAQSVRIDYQSGRQGMPILLSSSRANTALSVARSNKLFFYIIATEPAGANRVEHTIRAIQRRGNRLVFVGDFQYKLGKTEAFTNTFPTLVADTRAAISRKSRLSIMFPNAQENRIRFEIRPSHPRYEEVALAVPFMVGSASGGTLIGVQGTETVWMFDLQRQYIGYEPSFFEPTWANRGIEAVVSIKDLGVTTVIVGYQNGSVEFFPYAIEFASIFTTTNGWMPRLGQGVSRETYVSYMTDRYAMTSLLLNLQHQTIMNIINNIG